MIVAVRGMPVVNKPVDEHERELVVIEPIQLLLVYDSVATHVAYQELMDIGQANGYQVQDEAFLLAFQLPLLL